jgi:hypothetical protein
MSQLASKYDCENTEQLVAALVIHWNLPRATNELFKKVQEVEEANISLDEQVFRLGTIRQQFQIQNWMLFSKFKKAPPWSFFLAFSPRFYIFKACFREYLHPLFSSFLGLFL